MKLILHQYDLHLKHTFKIAHDMRDVQQTLIVELQDGDISGYGEATASKYYGKTIADMVDLLEANRSHIESYQYQDPADFWEGLKIPFQTNSFALSAIDVAIHDLYAKKKGLSHIQLWGGSYENLPVSNYTIGIDTVENMVSKLREFPWSSYKIKLGTNEDLKIIRELRSVTDATFRVDANCGWGVDETLRNAREMKSLGVEFIEQPLKADDWEGMKMLFAQSELPLIADESIEQEEDVSRCKDHFHGVNVKLMKCGGFTPARRMIATAKSLGMKAMVGCMTESSVGISAVAQLLPWLDYVDMDGFLLISNDTADGPKVKNGAIEIAKGAGIGVECLLLQ
ncbi:MAG: dipeptide epimerase [Cyclobacteriaceae bacterium]